MQIESQSLLLSTMRHADWQDNFFRYCQFTGAAPDGVHVTSVFQDCTFHRCDWYWPLFNAAVFIGTKFEDCTFRGSSMRGCRFVECMFARCTFEADNLDAPCVFDDCAWYDCRQEHTAGLRWTSRPSGKRP